jgi:hypothetical protein
MRTRPILIAVVLLSTLGLAGCSAASYSGADSGVLAPQSMPGNQYDGPGVADLESGYSQDSVSQEPRDIISVASMTVTVDNPITAAAKAAALAEGAGGRVDGRQEFAPQDGDAGSSTLTLRIPSSHLTTTIEDLKNLGDVVTVTLNATDVTGQVANIDARVNALRASVDRLTELLASAKDADVLVTIESSLSDRQQELESMEAQQRALGDQVSLSTLTVSFITTEQAPVVEPDTFLTGLEAGWGSFVGFINTMVVIFGVLLPWIVFFGIIALVIVLIVRRAMRVSPPPSE